MTIMLSQEFNCSYFDVLQQDVDDIILLINYRIEESENKEYEEKPQRKNDGFWDFD